MTKGLNVPSVPLKQMREVDRLMIEEYGILLIQMMENAAPRPRAPSMTLPAGVARHA